MRRLQTCHPAPLLIDQDRQVGSPGHVTQIVGQRPQLVRIGDIATEQNEAGGVRIAKQCAFGIAQGRARQSKQDGYHAPALNDLLPRDACPCL